MCADDIAKALSEDIAITKKKVAQLLSDPKFAETVTKHFINVIANKTRLRKQFYALVENYFQANMKMECPYDKAVKFFGALSGEYVEKQPAQVQQFFTKEQEDNINDIFMKTIKRRKGVKNGNN
jgi:hypothetical protein